MDPYSSVLKTESPRLGDAGYLVHVIAPPYMLMELVEAEFLCLDIKHSLIRTAEYGDVHHLTVARWNTKTSRSVVVGRVLMNYMTAESISDGLISLFRTAEEATGEIIDFFAVCDDTLFIRLFITDESLPPCSIQDASIDGNLKGFMLDFSQAEFNALILLFQYFHRDKTDDEIEERVAFMTKGCKFHWAQQVERNAKRVSECPTEVEEIKGALAPLAEEANKKTVLDTMQSHLVAYPKSHHWVKFWLRPRIRQMAFRAFATTTSWDKLPTTNNIAESVHATLKRICKSKSYPLVIMDIWKHDYGELLKIIAAEQGIKPGWARMGNAARIRANILRNVRLQKDKDLEFHGRPIDTDVRDQQRRKEQSRKKSKAKKTVTRRPRVTGLATRPRRRASVNGDNIERFILGTQAELDSNTINKSSPINDSEDDNNRHTITDDSDINITSSDSVNQELHNDNDALSTCSTDLEPFCHITTDEMTEAMDEITEATDEMTKAMSNFDTGKFLL